MSGIVPGLTVPKVGTPLSTYTEGSIIKINESGTPVEFYVAKHDYEAGLNGTGRTLVVRKDVHSDGKWNSTDINTYASSTVDVWLNGEYKNSLGSSIQEMIGATKFYYTPGGNNNNVTTLERSAFLLSFTELGETQTYVNTEGTALTIAETLQIAYKDGVATYQWTRSPYTQGSRYVMLLNATGSSVSYGPAQTYGIRPVFTLSSTILVDRNGQVIE